MVNGNYHMVLVWYSKQNSKEFELLMGRSAQLSPVNSNERVDVEREA